MWLYLVALVLVLLGVVGGVASGGIFTIILIPLGLIVAVSAFMYASSARSAQGSARGETEASAGTNSPLPHAPERDSGHVASSPERLADTRRAEQ